MPALRSGGRGTPYLAESPIVDIIIGMPPQAIMHGIPMAIIAFIALQRSVIMAMPD